MTALSVIESGVNQQAGSQFFIPDFSVQKPDWYLGHSSAEGDVVPSELPQVLLEGLGTFALLGGSLVQWSEVSPGNVQPTRLQSKWAEPKLRKILATYLENGEQVPSTIIISRDIPPKKTSK